MKSLKVLMLNGSPHANGNTAVALREMEAVFKENGVDVETVVLGNRDIRGCVACGSCAKTGKCVFDDGVNELAPKLQEADGLVIASPVYYASANATLIACLDRLFYSTGIRNLTMKVGAAVVSCRRAGSTASLDRLIKYFTINNMPLVSSQYWAQVHGTNPDEVRQDAEGMQTMRTLGENMAWLLRCIEAGKAAGVPAPAREPRVMTNFMR